MMLHKYSQIEYNLPKFKKLLQAFKLDFGMHTHVVNKNNRYRHIKHITYWISNEIVNNINIMSCPIKLNSNTIELTVHPPCFCILDLLCVMSNAQQLTFEYLTTAFQWTLFCQVIASEDWKGLREDFKVFSEVVMFQAQYTPKFINPPIVKERGRR